MVTVHRLVLKESVGYIWDSWIEGFIRSQWKIGIHGVFRRIASKRCTNRANINHTPPVEISNHGGKYMCKTYERQDLIGIFMAVHGEIRLYLCKYCYSCASTRGMV